MIQTKQPINYQDRGDKTGIILIDIPSFATTKEGATFLVNDWVIDEFGNKTIHSAREVFKSNKELDTIDAYLSTNYDFSGMTKTEEQWEKIKLGVMIDTTTSLLSNDKTIYRLNPEDWEFSVSI